MMSAATRSIWLVALLAVGVTNTLAFAPHPSSSFQKNQLVLRDALEVVDDEAPLDPFDAYETTAEQTTVAFKDTSVGTGTTVGAIPEQQLKIKYVATFLDPEPGTQFDKSENFLCKTGQKKILPGFEEGLVGMKVGGKRTIRVPPNKGYGDQWYKGTIPPNAHLQFECELLSIAESPQEEFMEELEKFGVGRAIGIAVCVGYLAVSPFL